jgi:predicted AlkP superfamily pyrophosphatase or phosphodiesterase
MPQHPILLALLLILLLAPSASAAPRPDTLVLISIDGFRADYLERGRTPTLARLAAEGTRARWLTPAFPSLTFPNHYTQVTGLDPDAHGLVHNTVADPAIDDVFSLSNRRAVGDGRWWGGTPVWVTVERAGWRTAPLFWPGSEAAIQGVRPTDWAPFDERLLPERRVDRLLDGLDAPEADRPVFLTLYFDLVDSVGHAAGPDSPRVDAALAATDRALARLLAGLARRGLAERTNLVIVSDHGMAGSSPRRSVVFDRLVAPEDATVRYWGTVIGVEPAPDRTAAVEAALLRPHARMECWRKTELPARFRYGNHPRVAPIVCLAKPGSTIGTADWVARNRRQPAGGSHGYDNALPEMRALFVAHGPAFRRGALVEPLEARDVYGVLMRALGLPPAQPEPHPERADAVMAGYGAAQ